jgi:transposase-like protein
MGRTEKKMETPHLRAVKSADAAVPDGAAAGPAAPATATKAPAPAARATEEVVAPRRRTFSAEFKRQVLAEADACTEQGEIGALLRRHGLYSSHLTDWRRQREEGTLASLAPRKRGRKAQERNPLAAENARLQSELKKATARAERAERLVELQKKVAELLGDPLPPPPPELMPEPPEPPRARTRRRR